MSGIENKRRVSLLENESRGGDTLEQGTTFQEMVVLSYIPYWLKQEGFDSLIRESIGDTEAKFYRPGFGSLKVFVEAKNHQVTRSKFWQEIDRFVRVDTDAANEYSQFVLASMGLAPNIRPVAESLRRVRDPRGFYQNSAILDISFDEFAKRVVEEGKSRQMAEFLFSKVLVDDRYNRGNEFGEFSASLNENLALDLRQTEVRNIYERLKTFIQSRLNQTITRREIETIISECLSDDSSYKKQPIYIHTAITKEDVNPPHSELVFDWEKYFDKSSYAICRIRSLERKTSRRTQRNQKLDSGKSRHAPYLFER